MIDLVRAEDGDNGQTKAHDLLKTLVDGQTLLALSGGGTPDYRKMLVELADIIPGAICVVDERFGEPFHEKSNELLLENFGVKDFADDKCIETHKVLCGKGFEETGEIYNSVIEDLFSRFKKRVGVMGIGADLHTAGILPYSEATKSTKYAVAQEVNDSYKKRITLTLKALAKFDAFVVMVLGEEKEEAIKKLLDEKEEDVEKYPAVFYRKSKIKSYLVTDIDV